MPNKILILGKVGFQSDQIIAASWSGNTSQPSNQLIITFIRLLFAISVSWLFGSEGLKGTHIDASSLCSSKLMTLTQRVGLWTFSANLAFGAPRPPTRARPSDRLRPPSHLEQLKRPNSSDKWSIMTPIVYRDFFSGNMTGLFLRE